MPEVDAAAPADAIVFVGGLSGRRQLQPERIAEILRRELERQANDRLATFLVRSVSVDNESVHRVERVDAGVSNPVIDLYCVANLGQATGSAPSAARRVFTLALQVIAGIVIWVGAWFGSTRRAKSTVQKLQLGFCLLILLCLGVYFLTAVYALVEAVYTAVAGAGNTVGWPQWVVLFTTVLGVLWPNAKIALAGAAETYQRAMSYLWTSGDRNQLTGRIEGLVDKINNRPEIRNVHLLGDSFGGLAVLDTVYPTSSAGQKTMQQVRTIVTIGCPFDLVRTLRPSYARDRGTATEATPRWVNVYAPIDLLASNFSDGDGVDVQPTTGVTLVDQTTRMPDVNSTWNGDLRLNAVNFLMLRSLQVHGEYWGTNTNARTALCDVVHALYRDTPVLG